MRLAWFSQRDYSQIENKQMITNFHFTASCHKDISEFLIEAWWYLWTNCPEVKSELMKSSRRTLVQTVPKHFVSIWDEVNFQKAEALSCGQFVHKHKVQTFNFYTNYVEVIFIFLFPIFLTLCQVCMKFFISTRDEVVSDHWHFRYLWASCPQDFPTICREVDCHALQK